MHNQQITINPPPRQSASFRFSLIVAGKPRERTPIPQPTIAVYCDLCSDQTSGTSADLLRAGWGIFSGGAFCPEHQEMI